MTINVTALSHIGLVSLDDTAGAVTRCVSVLLLGQIGAILDNFGEENSNTVPWITKYRIRV